MVQLFCYAQNKMKLDACCEKGVFVSYDKQSPAYLIYFLDTMVIKIHRLLWP